jgi:hypothetical protein
MTTKPALQKSSKESYTQKMKINIATKAWELLTLRSRQVIRVS